MWTDTYAEDYLLGSFSHTVNLKIKGPEIVNPIEPTQPTKPSEPEPTEDEIIAKRTGRLVSSMGSYTAYGATGSAVVAGILGATIAAPFLRFI